MGSERIPEAVLQLPQRRVGQQSYRHGGCPERQGVPAGDKVQVRSLEGGSRPWTRRRSGDCLTEEQRVIRHRSVDTERAASYVPDLLTFRMDMLVLCASMRSTVRVWLCIRMCACRYIA